MSEARPPLKVLLDEGAPRLAGDPFQRRGHQVIHHSEVCEGGASDEVVAAISIHNAAILIAIDNDMKRLVRRFGNPSNTGKFHPLNLISIGCDEVLAAKRIEYAMSFIEHEWDICRQKKARRLWIDIRPHSLISHR